jgi:PAS domain S-box-containing protein
MDHSIHLLDLVEKEKLEDILAAFTDVTGVASIITEADGRPITNPLNFTPLCQHFCRSTDKGRRKCWESDSYGGQESARTQKRVIYKCLNAGLLDSGYPIIVEGYHLATVLCGQVLDYPIESEVAIERAQAIDIEDIDGYLRALKEIPLISYDQFIKIVNLMEVVTQTVSELALKKYLERRYSQNYLNKLINSVSDAIISTDAGGNISMINEAGLAMFGYTQDTLVGQPLLSLFPDTASVRACRHLMDTRHNNSGRSELTGVTTDQQTFPAQISLSSIGDNNDARSVGYVAVLRDISEEKKLERMKDDLIGMLTHDMGNPVLSIQKAIQLITDEALGPLNGAQLEVMRLALGTSQQLLGMVTDFLDIYRSENGQFLLRKQLLELNDVLAQSIAQGRFFADDKRIQIQFRPERDLMEICGDRNRLLRTFSNLIDNAVKHSPVDSVISVCTHGLAQPRNLSDKLMEWPGGQNLNANTSYLLATITDHGIGIPEEHHKAIFDKFFTIHAKKRHGRNGTGLGLTFCKLVVSAHQGHIWVKSPVNDSKDSNRRGCCFHVLLPVDADVTLQLVNN